MKLSARELQGKANEIKSSFKTNYQVLYLGQGITPEDLSKEVCELPWACILTSVREADGFQHCFSNESRHMVEHTEEILRESPFQTDQLNILRIYGIDDETEEETDSFEEEFGRMENTSFLRNVAAQLDGIVKMHVIGYQPQAEAEVPVRTFMNFLKRSSGYKYIEFYGVKETNTKLQNMAQRMNCETYEQSLAEILTYSTLKSNPPISNLQNRGYVNTFYSNEEMYTIPVAELNTTYDDCCFLVTEECMQVIQPNGKASYVDFFLDFLEKSATDGPQWVGYQKRSYFYVERDYAKLLETVIRRKLTSNHKLPQKRDEGDVPIVLTGASGSSKSVVLAALAYKFYQEHQYPVLFLKDSENGEVLSQEEMNRVQNLVELLNNKTDNKVLIFWDCSSYKHMSQFQELIHRLTRRGRRFVLVGSAYEYQTLDPAVLYRNTENKREVSIYRFVEKENEFVEVRYQKAAESEEHFLFADTNGYYIKADRRMSETEQNQLKRIFREYSGISGKTLTNVFEQIQENYENDIFMYFYYLTTLLRPKLIGGLDHEHVMVGKYVQNRLNKICSNINESNLLMDNCCGDIEQLLAELEKADDDEDFDYELYEKLSEQKAYAEEMDPVQQNMLDRFNTCIALFSQFKMSVPYHVAVKMLDLEKMDDVIYSTENRQKELFLVLTESIPWIRYGRTGEKGDFAFRFRNPLEAALYLEGDSSGQNVENAEEQLNMIVQLMELYGEDYRDNDYEDMEFKKSLLALLKLLGPNTVFPEFKKNGKRYQAHWEILSSLEVILKEFKKLRDYWKVPDYDGGFAIAEISFSREFYRQSWDREVRGEESAEQDAWDMEQAKYIYSKEKYENRLENMKESLELAMKKVDEMKALYGQNENALAVYGGPGQIQRTRNNLENEMILGNIQANNLAKKYLRYCREVIKTEPDKVWENGVFTQSYTNIFRQMEIVINSDPGNGHYYNTLFKRFQQEYDNAEVDLERKWKYLAEISNIADMAESNELVNKGEPGDDVDTRIAWIREKEGSFEASMEEVLSRTDTPFYRMFQHMLEKQNPAGLLFVCRKELKKEGTSLLQTQEDLVQEERDRCVKVMEFLQRPEYESCVLKNTASLVMLIRVMWMAYSGKPITGRKECQYITMKLPQWEQLQNLCKRYVDIAGECAMPSIVLVYALATLQVTKSHQQCWEIMGKIRENNFYKYKEDRMKTPYIYCDEKGKPYPYNGRVLKVKNPNATVKVNGMRFPGSERGILLYVGWNNTEVKEGRIFDQYTPLELGLHYTGFKMYTKESRMIKVGK